jgi:hypothetical protein
MIEKVVTLNLGGPRDSKFMRVVYTTASPAQTCTPKASRLMNRLTVSISLFKRPPVFCMMLISFVAPADHLSLPSPVLSFSHRRLRARTPGFEVQRASPACAFSTAAMTQNVKHGPNYCGIQQRVAMRVPWDAYHRGH